MAGWLAITRAPSPRMSACIRTFVPCLEIDFDSAKRQHEQYCAALAEAAFEVLTLPPDPNLPDCAFVEDAAVILDELAIIGSMGTTSRRDEIDAVEPLLSRQREVVRIEKPATLEGGDVLRVGKNLFIAESGRTNRSGIEAFRAIAQPLNYRVIPIRVHGCLHLKTACTALPDGMLLVNPDWIDTSPLSGFEMIPVPQDEPWAANLLPVGDRILMPAGYSRTAQLVRARGFSIRALDLSEFQKAEGGVTCLSLLAYDASTM